MGARFEIFKDTSGEYRWRLLADNGEPVAQSEGYTQKHNAKSGADAVREAAREAEVVDVA